MKKYASKFLIGALLLIASGVAYDLHFYGTSSMLCVVGGLLAVIIPMCGFIFFGSECLQGD